MTSCFTLAATSAVVVSAKPESSDGLARFAARGDGSPPISARPGDFRVVGDETVCDVVWPAVYDEGWAAGGGESGVAWGGTFSVPVGWGEGSGLIRIGRSWEGRLVTGASVVGGAGECAEVEAGRKAAIRTCPLDEVVWAVAFEARAVTGGRLNGLRAGRGVLMGLPGILMMLGVLLVR